MGLQPAHKRPAEHRVVTLTNWNVEVIRIGCSISHQANKVQIRSESPLSAERQWGETYQTIIAVTCEGQQPILRPESTPPGSQPLPCREGCRMGVALRQPFPLGAYPFQRI